MISSWRRDRDPGFLLFAASAFVIGLWLRIYLINDQVLIDDEWHGLYYVIGKSPGWLLTHFSVPGATCIPLNFYAWCLGASVGWSETVLRLPSLLCGSLLVIAGPLLARHLIGAQRAALLALLLAISPLLVFYSRICRPYSAVALLTFSALLFAARWMQGGQRRFPILFLGAGVLAVYFHLFAVVAVAAPFLTALGFHAWSRWLKRPAQPAPGPPLKHWLIVMAVMAGVTALAVLPALIHSMQTTFFTIARAGTFDVRAVPRVAVLLSGTGQPVLALLFWAALVAGALEQVRRNPWFGLTLVSLYPLHALALLVSRPDAAQSAIVLTRYCIPLLPVSLLLVAGGLQTAIEFLASRMALKPALQGVLACAAVVALAFAGPLPQCYVAPNNFTNHGAYQHRYGPIDWHFSFYSDLTPANFKLRTTIRVDEVSPFYRYLAEHPGPRPIVEYPMMIGDHFNPLYYYQHFHGRPLVVGYATNTVLARGLAAGNIYGSTYVDQVLTLVKDPGRPRFRNMMLMEDLMAMRRRGVEYIILHKFFEAQLRYVADPPPELERIWRHYLDKLGPPAYEDEQLVAFRL